MAFLNVSPPVRPLSWSRREHLGQPARLTGETEAMRGDTNRLRRMESWERWDRG